MHTNLICHTLLYDDAGLFLVMRRASDESVLPGQWDVPGGSLEGRETPLDCAKREVKEEAGIKIPSQEVDLAFHTSTIDEDKGERFVRLLFIYGPVWSDVVVNEEHDAYKWVEPEVAREDLQLVAYLHECFESIESNTHSLSRLTDT